MVYSKLRTTFNVSTCVNEDPMEKIFFWFKVMHMITVKRKGYNSKRCPRVMGDFVFFVKMPLNNQLRMISRVHGHDICVFLFIERDLACFFIASFDTYQITNRSNSKRKFSFYLIFKEFEKEFSNQQLLGKNIILSKTWSTQN